MSKVSIICSTWNRPDCLERLIENLKRQTYKKWELLIMDESPDFYSRVHKSRKIKPIHCQRFNDWGYSVKEIGARQSTGELLCFPADDAQYDSTFLEKLALDYDLIYCNCTMNGPNFIVQPKIGHIDIGGFLVSRQAFDYVNGFEDKSGCGDGEFIERVIRQGFTQYKVEETLYFKT